MLWEANPFAERSAKGFASHNGCGDMRRIPYHVWIYVGILLLLLGLQMRMVGDYVFTPGATATLNQWFGPDSAAPGGAFGPLAIGTPVGYQTHFQPPVWVGYGLLSAGAVFFIHGILLKRK